MLQYTSCAGLNDLWGAKLLRLIKLDIRLDFAEEIREYSLVQKVYRAITGKMPKEMRPQMQEDVLIRSPKSRLAVRWDRESFAMVLEEAPNIDKFAGIVIPQLDRINEVAPIVKLKRRMLITNWLLPAANYDFRKLEEKYRETMIAQQLIQGGAFDSGVILDIKVGNWVLHHQSGAMGIKQLLDDYLIFKTGDVPKVFLFMLASITERKVIQYSGEDMRSFLVKSFDLCKSHSNVFEQIWEEIL